MSFGLEIDGTRGITLEFWLNKEGFPVAKTKKEVIFDLWNGVEPNRTTDSGVVIDCPDYGRLRIELSSSIVAAKGAVFRVTAMSGSEGFYQTPIAEDITETTMINR